MSDKFAPNEIHQDTSTDMYIGLIANDVKLVSEKKQRGYGDKMSDTSSDSDSDSDRKVGDNINNYKKHTTDKSDRSESSETKSEPAKIFNSDTHTHTHTHTNNTNNGVFKEFNSDEIRRKKFDMIVKLGELKKKGVTISQNYDMNSNLEEMEDEYNIHTRVRAKSNGLNVAGHMLIGCVRALEMLNDNYNPFDIKLDGLSTSIKDDMEPYYDVLGELYDKYNRPGSNMAPEFKLLMLIGGAGLQLQLRNFVPNMIKGQAKKVNENKDLMKNLAKIASTNSDNHRDQLKKSMQKDNDKNILDAKKFIKEKELEAKKAQNQDITSIMNIEFSESTGKSGKSKKSSSSSSKLSKLSKSLNSEKKLAIINQIKKQKIQNMEMNLKRSVNNSNQVSEEQRLRELMSRIDKDNSNDDDDDDDDDNDCDSDSDDSNSSSESTLSQNPKGIQNLISRNMKKSTIKKGDISIGSTDNKKNKVNISVSNVSKKK
jgi:hypothetical protein